MTLLFLVALVVIIYQYVQLEQSRSPQRSSQNLTSAPKEYPTYGQSIVLFGDSITELAFDEGGWGSLLNAYLSAQATTHQRLFDIQRRGFCGYNTRNAVALLPYVFHPHGRAISLVVLFWGTNDAAAASSPYHVPAHEYEANMARIITFFQTSFAFAPEILVITPGPNTMPLGGMYHNSQAQVYAEAAMKVAKEFGLPCIDIWTLMQREPVWEKFLRDGLHFSSAGSEFVARHIIMTFQTLKLFRSSGRASDIYPDHPTVNHEDVNGTKVIVDFFEARKN